MIESKSNVPSIFQSYCLTGFTTLRSHYVLLDIVELPFVIIYYYNFVVVGSVRKKETDKTEMPMKFHSEEENDKNRI